MDTSCTIVTVDTLAGLNPGEASWSFDFFPNPSSGTVNFRWEQEKEGIFWVSLLDMKGRLIRTEKFPPGRAGVMDWDLKALPEGVYLLKIETPGEEILTRKLILE